MANHDPNLARINRALRDLGASLSLEVSPSGGRLRPRATVPTPEGGWKQRRITIALPFPSGVDQARQLAEELGRDLELHKRGLEAFPHERWADAGITPGASLEGISGAAALSKTEAWWRRQRKRGPSADTSWMTAYATPLRPLLDQRLPKINLDRDHRTEGSQLGVALRRHGATFQTYDLRHAWAVRAIHHSQISPSLAAKM